MRYTSLGGILSVNVEANRQEISPLLDGGTCGFANDTAEMKPSILLWPASLALNVSSSADLMDARLNIASGSSLQGKWSTVSGGQSNSVQAGCAKPGGGFNNIVVVVGG